MNSPAAATTAGLECNVCGDALGSPIYDAGHDRALTSLCERRSGRTRVWSCARCAHLRGEELVDTAAYYASDYRILLDRDDEDQIYEMRDGCIVYRTQHQVEVLQRKLTLPMGSRLLDYGCAKASTPRALLNARPDLNVHLFDVSTMYERHWDQFVLPSRRAVHKTPPEWSASFDVVTSFFALEHIPEPRETVRRIAALLKDDGVFYAIVPDTFGNPADLVVIDHVNHFTGPSIHHLLRDAGFAQIEVDAGVHRGAHVVWARKGGQPTGTPAVPPVLAQSADLARFWSTLASRIRHAESALGPQTDGTSDVAIYGSGFYGAYIASTLEAPGRVRCFLDRSPFQQGKSLFETPILAPEALPDGVRTVFVGLNPRIARETMAAATWVQERGVDLVFIDEAGA